ncbi:TPM domain-containing protein [Hymenobacter psoromatis]|uniref:TPM domain-containing protein n=1 Tax=Hymenobacter psoromatis TaxID=1484116 RepID=UPI001CBDF0CB|nr:TPM domain-containing protein [Hymenobacter psoromatis]
MNRFVFLLLWVGVCLHGPVAAQSANGLPARPVPFTFVTDQGNLLSAGDAKKLDGGLRSYAEKTGTQVVVVTVPSLGGRSAADYARALGTAWGVGQRGKNNGVVVLLSAQDHKVSIQPGAGLARVITPAVTSRVIGEMTPEFKQGNYFAGLRAGLNRLLVTANPGSAPGQGTTSAATTTGAAGAAGSSLSDNNAMPDPATPAATLTEPAGAIQSETAPAPVSPGIGMGALLIGALVIGGILFFIIRMFRSKSAASNNGGTPSFYPNANANAQPNQPTFYPNQNGPTPGNYPNQGGNTSGGSGMGGILATGAAAAAGAYLGNRLGGSHDSGSSAPQQFGNNTNNNSGLGAGAAAAGTGAAGDYFSGRGGSSASSNDDKAPDYFSGNESSNSGDYFSSDNSSYDDTSSGDTGGGGFDSTDDNSGSW